MLSRFPLWNVIAMLASLAVVAGLEILAILTHRHLTLTYLIRGWIPKPLICATLAWLAWHFLVAK